MVDTQFLVYEPICVRSEQPHVRPVRACGGFVHRTARRLVLLTLLVLATGCASVPVNVSNPIPGMTTIAVAPFFNLSAEPTVDGRRFANAYFSELQKTGNFQVIPVGVVEVAIRENELDMGSAEDAIRLARLLDADAVVVGAVTDYKPYYPPQLGLHIQWYSPREWMFVPLPGANGNRPAEGNCPVPGEPCLPGANGNMTVRAQSEDELETRGPGFAPPAPPSSSIRQAQSINRTAGTANSQNQWGPVIWPSRPEPDPSLGARSHSVGSRPGAASVFARPLPPQPDTTQPLMAYTRFFDGADPELIRNLKHYHAYRGDMRAGGWEAYLHRSDDFIHFTAHLMVMEMLTLHGGTLKTDYVFPYLNWR
jgi:hypothetical protein